MFAIANKIACKTFVGNKLKLPLKYSHISENIVPLRPMMYSH